MAWLFQSGSSDRRRIARWQFLARDGARPAQIEDRVVAFPKRMRYLRKWEGVVAPTPGLRAACCHLYRDRAGATGTMAAQFVSSRERLGTNGNPEGVRGDWHSVCPDCSAARNTARVVIT